MRAIIQRVMNASVSVGGEKISEIGRGLCVLVGISRDDTPQDMDYLVRKILNLRLFDGENDRRWHKSVMDQQYEILCVSQFTLYHILKGNKPDFHEAMGPDKSEDFYNEFLQKMKRGYSADKIKNGVFGADMQVNIQNDGPVTVTLESPALSEQEKEKYRRKQEQALKKQCKQPGGKKGQSSNKGGNDKSENSNNGANNSSETPTESDKAVSEGIGNCTEQQTQESVIQKVEDLTVSENNVP